MLNTLYDVYSNNIYPNFTYYVKRYCIKHDVTPEIACQHALVREAYFQYSLKPKTKKGEENVYRDCDYSNDRSC